MKVGLGTGPGAPLTTAAAAPSRCPRAPAARELARGTRKGDGIGFQQKTGDD